jgi:translation initiation factor IF-2
VLAVSAVTGIGLDRLLAAVAAEMDRQKREQEEARQAAARRPQP